MKKKKIILKSLLIILIIIFAITLYFYQQHRYSVETTYIDTYIELEEVDLYITSVSTYNFEEKVPLYAKDSNALTKWFLNSKLPFTIKSFVFRLKSFYSLPYDFYEDGLSRYVLNAVILAKSSDSKDINDDSSESNRKYFKVTFVETASDNKRSSLTGGSEHMDSANYYTTHAGTIIPFESVDHLLITDILNDSIVEIKFHDDPVLNTYNFFKREPASNNIIRDNPVGKLIRSYHYQQMDVCNELIHPDYLASFDWSLLDEISITDHEVATLEYLGEDQGFDHVFFLTVTDHVKELGLKIVYLEGSWLIIGP